MDNVIFVPTTAGPAPSARLWAWSTSPGSTPAPATTGRTALGDLSRTRKTDPRLAAYADVNEANAAIGVAVAAGDLPDDVRIGAHPGAERPVRHRRGPVDAAPAAATSTPRCGSSRSGWPSSRPTATTTSRGSEKLRSFILPGGTVGAAHLHLALTVVRRAERSVWAAVEAYGTEPGDVRGEGGVNPVTATYLNRLSDLLFVLARCANLPGGDVLWAPAADASRPPDRKG